MATVVANQSIFDIANQENGSVLSALALAIANGLSVTDELVPGSVLRTVSSEFDDADRQRYFMGRILATSGSITDIQPQPQGIDFMAIDIDFIVT